MAFGRSFVRSGTYRVEPPSAAELDHLLRQRAKLKKDAFKDGVFDLVRDAGKSALRWVGMDPSFWVAQGVYTLLRVYARGKGATPFPTLTPLSAVGSLCAFIVVFYTSQAWSRFMTLYGLCMQLEGRVFDTALLAQATLPPAAAQQLWRHLNAAHVLAYVGVSQHYTESNLLAPLNERYRLLTLGELERVRAIGLNGGGATREVLSWCVSTIQAQYLAKRLTHVEKGPLIDQVLRFRSAVGSIYDFMDLPVPFIYTSFVAIVCILYPSLFSATVALCFDTAAHTRTHAPNEIIGLFLSLFNGFFFCGLRTIATKFQDPFDHSYEDLSVLHFARFTIEASAKILQRDPPAPLDEGLEWELQAQRQWGKLLGGAWAGGAEAEAEAPPGEGGAAHAGVPMPAHVC